MKKVEDILRFIKRHRESVAAYTERFVYGNPVQRRLLLGLARRRFAAISKECGGSGTPYLFTIQSHSAKLVHNEDVSTVLEQIVLYMLPHRLNGIVNVCRWSTKGCRAVCLHTSGRLGLPPADRAKLARTLMFARHPESFMVLVLDEIERHRKRCAAKGRTLVVRLNGTSDIPYEQLLPEMFWYFEDVLFQDYTKDGANGRGFERDVSWIPNYYTVLSATENTPDSVFATHVGNVVVPVHVRRGAPLPKRFAGRRVIDGDEHDLRLIDKQGKFAVLVRAKGDGVGDVSGFVRSV